LIVLVMRSRKPFWQTHPAPVLAAANAVAIVTTIVLPYTPLAEPLGFVALPVATLAALLGIAGVYAATAETAKHWFFSHGNGN
jgi:Mg2+-importing ATPase